MQSRPAPLASIAVLALILSGCAPARGDFPSLLPRPIEDRSDAVAVAEPVEVAPDPTLDTRITALASDLDQADRAFADAAAAAARLAAAAGPAGSDSWLAVQVALAEVDTLRTPVVAIVSQLEQLAIDRGIAGLPPYPALDSAIAAARARNEAQIERVQAIEATLAPA